MNNQQPTPNNHRRPPNSAPQRNIRPEQYKSDPRYIKYRRKKLAIKYSIISGFYLFLAIILLGICLIVWKCSADDPNDNNVSDQEVDLPVQDVESNANSTESDNTENESDLNNETDEQTEQVSESESETTEIEERNYEYATDLSEYLQYIAPEDPKEYLILINYENYLDNNYAPTDLIDVVDTRKDRAPVKLREYAAKALEALFIDARALGYDFSVTSAYRDYATQNYLFNNKVNEYSYLGDAAREEAAKIVAIPGTSEHQSGLCIDMHNLPAADVSFAEKAEAKWLAENSYKYGFILRFPEDKQDITKISYEPWHFRFVGREAATEMYELGMCLEEYIEYLNGQSATE